MDYNMLQRPEYQASIARLNRQCCKIAFLVQLKMRQNKNSTKYKLILTIEGCYTVDKSQHHG